jgi:hypothetical protein
LVDGCDQIQLYRSSTSDDRFVTRPQLMPWFSGRSASADVTTIAAHEGLGGSSDEEGSEVEEVRRIRNGGWTDFTTEVDPETGVTDEGSFADPTDEALTLMSTIVRADDSSLARHGADRRLEIPSDLSYSKRGCTNLGFLFVLVFAVGYHRKPKPRTRFV